MRTIDAFAYTSITPSGYVCETCGAHGVRLYREYQTFYDHTSLTCTGCTEKAEGKTVDTKHPDSIGWRVAAVPTEDGTTFWGYTSVPQAGVEWWRRLPTEVR